LSESIIVLYDVQQESIASAMLMSMLPLFAVLLLGGLMYLFAKRALNAHILRYMRWWLPFAALICLPTPMTRYRNYADCSAWLRNGDFSVTEGAIMDFRSGVQYANKSESFTVNGIYFYYSPYDLRTGGLHESKDFKIPLRNDLKVRIWHHDQCILKMLLITNELIDSSNEKT
jgi:hypothetical protein